MTKSIAATLCAVLLACSCVYAQSETPPNVVFILADDLGYGDLGCYDHPYAKTPNIDGLAKSGTRFNRFYATGVTCQPSRVGFMTSRHPRSFERRVGDFGFDGRPTITQLLNDNGYATGHFGKWHIGPGVEGKKASEKVPPASDYGIDEVKILESLKDRTKGVTTIRSRLPLTSSSDTKTNRSMSTCGLTFRISVSHRKPCLPKYSMT